MELTDAFEHVINDPRTRDAIARTTSQMAQWLKEHFHDQPIIPLLVLDQLAEELIEEIEGADQTLMLMAHRRHQCLIGDWLIMPADARDRELIRQALKATARRMKRIPNKAAYLYDLAERTEDRLEAIPPPEEPEEPIYPLESFTCPLCGFSAKYAARPVNGARPPRMGDLTVCYMCASPLILDAELQPHAALKADLDQLKEHDREQLDEVMRKTRERDRTGGENVAQAIHH